MFHVITASKPNPEDIKAVRRGILAFNHKNYGEVPSYYSVILKNEKDGVQGGSTVYVHSDSIFIDILWVSDKFRGQGFGNKIMDAVEAEAKKRGCKYATVDTFDFQAEPFYKKRGYYDIGTIKEYVLGFDRIFLRKNLEDGSA